MTFGQMLRDARKRAGKSQSEAAAELGILQSALSRWENDIMQPRTLKLPEVCDVMGLDADAAMQALAATGRAESEAA